MYRVLIRGIVILSSIGLLACRDKKDDTKAEYDRAAMLENIGKNIIIPSYDQLSESLSELENAFNAFKTNPDVANLETLQGKYLESYLKFQTAVIFDFGPAADVNALDPLNIYPTSATSIEENIGSGDYDLDAGNQLDTRGYPALDYLLHGVGASNTEILEMYTSDSKAKGRMNYIQAILDQLNSRVANNQKAWAADEDNYLATFIAANGTDVGSSTGIIVNQFNYNYEGLKNFKIGVPAGVTSLIGSKFPEKVEAYYSGHSLVLAKKSLDALFGLYKGVSLLDDIDGEGLDDYLEFNECSYTGGNLNAGIVNEYSEAIAALEAIPETLSESITSNNEVVETAYEELQQVVIRIKTDLPSCLSVLITYEDGDGD